VEGVEGGEGFKERFLRDVLASVALPTCAKASACTMGRYRSTSRANSSAAPKHPFTSALSETGRLNNIAVLPALRFQYNHRTHGMAFLDRKTDRLMGVPKTQFLRLASN